MLRSLLRTLEYSSQTLYLNVVKKPFKSGGKFYPAGSVITSPVGIKLYKTKVKDGVIIKVDEHNLESTLTYLKYRRKASEEILKNVSQSVRIVTVATKMGIATEGRQIKTVLEDIREQKAKE